ncbi:uncharacterized protein LOC126830466 [Patella vulgata]|uniref:uncharacterized protein LOC126830466 n=1 Tax=Patella vulgata TaxID=6465 RepID=UPI00217FDD29|nr:uncharacterized protein LOC126830466 [Patella vulgata]
MKGRYRIKECAETSQTIKQNTEHDKLRLKQTIRLLERSKTTTISTITSNQKRLFRGFQAKIYQSKLFYARMWEDKNMERCLRAQRTNYLNTNLSDSEAELEANKTVDFKPRIRQFCESLEPLVVSDDQERQLDYYSYKIRADFRDTKNKILPQRTITPEFIRRKYIGDVHVRNLTLNRLNLDSNED